MIVQTVAMPVYNADKIAWLAMEGLCHQEVTHNWELIICEEAHPKQLGESFFKSYKDRLPNCSEIKYIEIPEWVPLGRKWQIMGRAADENSKSFVLQATDDYSGRHRLQINHDIISSGVDWIDFTKAYFYSFALGVLRMYDFKGKRNLSIAFTTDFARIIPDCDAVCGIDTFLVGELTKWRNGTPNIQHSDFLIEDSLFTHGYNTISKTRMKLLEKPHRPYKKTNTTILTINIPESVRERILKMNYKHNNVPRRRIVPSQRRPWATSKKRYQY